MPGSPERLAVHVLVVFLVVILDGQAPLRHRIAFDGEALRL